MKITIITVCYNAEKEIGKTIKSVVDQTWKDIQYLIIDGMSGDGTLSKANRYLEDKRICLFSEPDQGIYDAMNKGIAKATGEYINFLNAGDCFWDENVLSDVVEQMQKTKADIYYGNTLFAMRGHELYCENPSDRGGVLKAAMRREMLNHQSMFVKSELLRVRSFDIRYRISADLEWLCYGLDKKFGFEKINRLICKYDQTGLSSRATSYASMKSEMNAILKKYEHLKKELQVEIDHENELYYYDLARRNQFIMNQMNQWLLLLQEGKSLALYFSKHQYEKVVVYGMGMLGRRLIDELKNKGISVVYGMDKRAEYYTGEFPVYLKPATGMAVDVVCVTACAFYHEIKSELERTMKCDIVSLEEVIAEASEEE